MKKNQKEKIALVFGSTGLTGRLLTTLLLEDDRYAKVVAFSRHPIGISHPRLENRLNDLTDTKSLRDEIYGDDLFCCLGTTMKKAGSKANFRKIDYELPVFLAETGYANGVDKFLVMSSIGADPASRNFYLRTKGEMEQEVKRFNYSQIAIFRPSLLMGNRDEQRFGEGIGRILYTVFGFLFIGPLRKYRGIKAVTVARAMLKAANTQTGFRVYLSDEIQDLGA